VYYLPESGGGSGQSKEGKGIGPIISQFRKTVAQITRFLKLLSFKDLP